MKMLQSIVDLQEGANLQIFQFYPSNQFLLNRVDKGVLFEN
jgi:hypothetical protein